MWEMQFMKMCVSFFMGQTLVLNFALFGHLMAIFLIYHVIVRFLLYSANCCMVLPYELNCEMYFFSHKMSTFACLFFYSRHLFPEQKRSNMWWFLNLYCLCKVFSQIKISQSNHFWVITKFGFVKITLKIASLHLF